MDPIKNPYAPGAGTRPPELAGRDGELDNFKITMERLRALKAVKCRLYTGLRGVGKTVLLTTFENIAEGLGDRVAIIEVTNETKLKDRISTSARKIILSLDLKENIKDKVLDAARVLKAFSLTGPADVKFGFDIDAIPGRGDSGELSEDLSELFLALGSAAKDRGAAVVFLFDEVHLLGRPDFEALISAVHRAAQKNLPVVVFGAGLPQLPKLAGEAKSYAERLFDFVEIGKLDEASARVALAKPAQDLNVAFEREAVDFVLEFTDCYPYFLQEFGKHAWNIGKNERITLDDVRSAEAAVTHQLDESFFKVRIARATPGELKLLSAMASLGEGPYKIGDVAAKLNRETSSLGPTRANLMNKGLIFSTGFGDIDFTVPKFDAFMRRTHAFVAD